VSLTARRSVLASKNVSLRKRLVFYQEHQIRPRPPTASARFCLPFWCRFCHWRNALVIVKPETLIGWDRDGVKLCWRWSLDQGATHSRKLRQLIAEMVRENPTWVQARVGDELLLKLGIKVSPRTYEPTGPDPAHSAKTGIAILAHVHPQSCPSDCRL